MKARAKSVRDFRKIFRERMAYTIYFVPYFLSETGVLFEFKKGITEIEDIGRLGMTGSAQLMVQTGKSTYAIKRTP